VNNLYKPSNRLVVYVPVSVDASSDSTVICIDLVTEHPLSVWAVGSLSRRSCGGFGPTTCLFVILLKIKDAHIIYDFYIFFINKLYFFGYLLCRVYLIKSPLFAYSLV
jgi:hypothetical protein